MTAHDRKPRDGEPRDNSAESERAGFDLFGGSDQEPEEEEVLGGPDNDEHELLGGSDREAEQDEVLGGPDNDEHDLLGGSDQEAEEDEVLGGPDRN